MNATEPTADSRYSELMIEALSRLSALESKIQRNEAEFSRTGSRNWGMVGDLAHIVEKLQEITQ